MDVLLQKKDDKLRESDSSMLLGEEQKAQFEVEKLRWEKQLNEAKRKIKGLEREIEEKENLLARTTDNTYHELVGERKEEVRNIERKIDELTVELRKVESDIERKQKEK